MKGIYLVISVFAFAFACLGINVPAEGSDCRRVVLQPVAVQAVSTYVAPVYQAPVVQTILTTAYLPVPAYSVSYAPQNGELIAQIQALRAEVHALKIQPAAPAPAPTPTPKEDGPIVVPQPQKVSFNVFVKRCANCHDKGTAAAKGKLILTDGQEMVDLSCEVLLKMTLAVATERMPKGGKLSDAELSEAVQWIESKAGVIASTK